MGRLERCHSIEDLRRAARRRLPWPMWEFLEGGSDDEWTLRRNRQAFERWALVPRVGVDTSQLDTRTRALGIEWPSPIGLAPTGMNRMYHGEGERAVVRAAARRGTVYGLSTYSSVDLETVAAEAPGPKVFQLFTSPGLERALGLVDRAREAGYDALCLTVDTTAPPNKERDLRSGLETGRLGARSLLSIAAHPRWVLGLLRGGAPRLANLDLGPSEVKAVQWREANRLCWEDVKRIRDRWPRAFALKGVLSAADAARAAALGVDAVILSNHGGRQMDRVPAPLEVLPEVVQDVGGRIEVLLDSGVRRASDVLVALALGARAVFVGRAYVFGLAAGGEAGVERCLDILDAELRRDMTLLGLPSVAAIDASLVRPAPPLA